MFSSPFALLRSFGRDWFLIGMLITVLLASFFPDAGKSGGWLHMDNAVDIGVAVVFFLHGMTISLESFKAGLLRWPVHIIVQLLTYALFPLLFYPFQHLFSGFIPPALMLGFLYLCVLPSTITSSVAMTAMAKGNVPVAIFNATFSSLLGIVMTPLLVSLMSKTHGSASDLSLLDTILDIARMLLLPLVVGQLARPFLFQWFKRYKAVTGKLDKMVILMLVFAAFCNSVAAGLWRDNGLEIIVVTLAGAALLLGIVLVLSTWLARHLGFSVEDEITIVFCGSKKTLATGVPMAALLFGASPSLGLIVLPVMFYHQLQLFICSILAARYARR